MAERKPSASRVIRAKFTITSVSPGVSDDRNGNVLQSEHITASAVADDDPSSENHKFWEATPSASLELYINNKSAWGTFRAGQYVYVDISDADSK